MKRKICCHVIYSHRLIKELESAQTNDTDMYLQSLKAYVLSKSAYREVFDYPVRLTPLA
jgi:hypothetical protein